MALQLHPAATLVAQASARLIEEVANLQAGRHTRCQLSTGLSSNSAKPWKDSSAKRARRHSMPAECAQPLSVHSWHRRRLKPMPCPKASLWWQWTRLVPWRRESWQFSCAILLRIWHQVVLPSAHSPIVIVLYS